MMSAPDQPVLDEEALEKVIADCLADGGRELDLRKLPYDAAPQDSPWGWPEWGEQNPKLFSECLEAALRRLPDVEYLHVDIWGEQNAILFSKRVMEWSKLRRIDLMVGVSDESNAALWAIVNQPSILPLIQYIFVNCGDDGLTAMASKAEYFTGLREFWFCVCDFRDAGVMALADQAKHFRNLEVFSDDDQDLGHDDEERMVGTSGANALLNFTQLKKIKLSSGRWKIGDDWSRMLAERADLFKNLTDLELYDTEIGDAGLKSLALAWHRGGFGRLEHLNIYSESTKISIVAPEVLGSGNATQIFEAVLDGLSLPEAKVLVLGEPAAGKTSLCRRVFLNRPADPSRRKETHDFELLIPTWRPRVKGQEVTLRVWDFGGQHVLHGTHEMFLTSRSVCVLVVDSTQVAEHDTSEPDEERNGNRLTYWLEMIRHFVGQDAHVILVETKNDCRDKRLGSIDVEGLRLRLQFTRPIRVVREFSATAGKDDGAVEDLRRTIHESLELLDLPRVGRPFVAIKDLIDHRMRGRALIGLEEYRSLCREIEIRKATDQDGYLRTLHYFGSVFFWGLCEVDRRLLEERRRRLLGAGDLPPGQQRLLEAERDPALQRWLINPHWLKRPLYELIRKSEGQPWISADEIRKAAHRRRAQIESDDLNAAEDVLFAVLKLTELCFHDRGRGKYFFPRGLSRDSGAFLTGWEESNRHEACWEWKFFPETVIHRFIVQAHERQEVLNRAQWRTGVVLQRGEAMVAVQCHPEQGQVVVWLKKRENNRDQPSRADGELLREIRLRFRDLVGRAPDGETRSWKELANTAIGSTSRTLKNETNLAAENEQNVSLLSERLATVYQMYEAAKKKLGNPKDREAYDWSMSLLKDQDPEYEMLEYETWSRYLRDARKLLGKSKNTPRRGRTGRSIVGENEI